MPFHVSAIPFHSACARRLCLAAGVALFGLAPAIVAPAIVASAIVASARAEEPSSILAESPAYRVSVENVTAKVGAHTVIHAVLRPKDGFRILKGYENRVARFSSADDGVAFDTKMIRGEVEGDSLVFAIGVTPTKPGKHPINGVFRVGYLQGSNDLSMVSLPLITTVTGTE
jgi:hypothetical protein